MARAIIKVIFFCVLAVSCIKKESTGQNFHTEENKLMAALFHGKFCKIDSMLFSVSYKDNVFLLGQNMLDTARAIHLINFKTDDNELQDLYFTTADLQIADSLHINLEDIWVMKKGINSIKNTPDKFNRISYSSTQKDQMNSSLTYNLYNVNCHDGKNYLQDHLLKSALTDIHFEKILKTNIFFKTSSRYYILLEKDFIYFISNSPPQPSTTFMFHLLREDGTFVNKDFILERHYVGPFKKEKFQKLYIAKILFERSDFVSMRIGEYTRLNGLPDVKWSQTILLEQVFSNELLIYENQFE